MAYAYPPIPSPGAERLEQLARLVYELLDAHRDTELLVREQPHDELRWRAHLSYLRDLQRVGRQVLAQPLETTLVAQSAADFGARLNAPRVAG